MSAAAGVLAWSVVLCVEVVVAAVSPRCYRARHSHLPPRTTMKSSYSNSSDSRSK